MRSSRDQRFAILAEQAASPSRPFTPGALACVDCAAACRIPPPSLRPLSATMMRSALPRPWRRRLRVRPSRDGRAPLDTARRSRQQHRVWNFSKIAVDAGASSAVGVARRSPRGCRSGCGRPSPHPPSHQLSRLHVGRALQVGAFVLAEFWEALVGGGDELGDARTRTSPRTSACGRT